MSNTSELSQFSKYNRFIVNFQIGSKGADIAGTPWHLKLDMSFFIDKLGDDKFLAWWNKYAGYGDCPRSAISDAIIHIAHEYTRLLSNLENLSSEEAKNAEMLGWIFEPRK